jgi:type VI secretion system secreted protein Hcp
MKSNSFLLTGILILLCVSLSSAQKGYIKIGDIKGESTERAHRDWILIENISQGLEQQAQMMTGATRRLGSVVAKDLVITKKLDKSTPKLMEMCSKGQVVPELELDMVSNGKVYYKLTLNNVRISSINTSTSCEPDCLLVDEVSMSYSKITWEYWDSNGSKVVASYNFEMGN